MQNEGASLTARTIIDDKPCLASPAPRRMPVRCGTPSVPRTGLFLTTTFRVAYSSRAGAGTISLHHEGSEAGIPSGEADNHDVGRRFEANVSEAAWCGGRTWESCMTLNESGVSIAATTPGRRPRPSSATWPPAPAAAEWLSFFDPEPVIDHEAKHPLSPRNKVGISQHSRFLLLY